jgi:RNA polymerase sigma-70 factor (ECF subfamily)
MSDKTIGTVLSLLIHDVTLSMLLCLYGRRMQQGTAPLMIVFGQEDEASRDEIRLMQAARADLTRFAPLYERYFPRIYAYCLHRVENEEAAEDLTSAIFTYALQGIHSYSGGSVAAWLFRIAHNAVANHYRNRRPSVSFEESDLDFADEQREMAEEVILAERHETLAELINQLPHGQRELLALKITGGLTAEDIAVMLGKSPGAVRVELHRIIKKLRAQYEQRGLA